MRNGKDATLSQASSFLPDVSGAVSMILQPVRIGVVSTNIVNGYPEDITNWINTQAVKQPFNEEQLLIRPEGERSWQWYSIHSLPDLQLNTGDKIIFNDMTFKVMARINAVEYGYLEYHVIEYYTDTE